MRIRSAAFAWFPLLSLALAWGCAQGAASDEGNSIDTALPAADAGSKKKDAGGSSSGESVPPASNDPNTDDPDPADPNPTPKDAGTSPKDAGTSPKDSGTITPPTSPRPTQGEVLITEVMYDPSGTEPASEWFELHNTSSSTRLLSGLTIADGANRTHVIGTGVTIGAGAYVLFVRNQTVATTTMIPSAAIAYAYGAGIADNAGIQLANGSTGGLELRDGSTVIAHAPYGGWFTQSGGASVQLKTLTYSASAQSASWCLSSSPWTLASDKGTPGAASDCP